MKRTHFLFALLLLCFSFLQEQVAAQSISREEKYVWFAAQHYYGYLLYGTEQEVQPLISPSEVGRVAYGYLLNRLYGPNDPFSYIVVNADYDDVITAQLIFYGDFLSGPALYPDIAIYQ